MSDLPPFIKITAIPNTQLPTLNLLVACERCRFSMILDSSNKTHSATAVRMALFHADHCPRTEVFVKSANKK